MHIHNLGPSFNTALQLLFLPCLTTQYDHLSRSIHSFLSYSIFVLFLFYLNKFIYLFGCVGSSLLRAGFSLVVASVVLVHRLSCSSSSCCGAWAVGTWVSVVVACSLSSCGSWALERRLSSCGARA